MNPASNVFWSSTPILAAGIHSITLGAFEMMGDNTVYMGYTDCFYTLFYIMFRIWLYTHNACNLIYLPINLFSYFLNLSIPNAKSVICYIILLHFITFHYLSQLSLV